MTEPKDSIRDKIRQMSSKSRTADPTWENRDKPAQVWTVDTSPVAQPETDSFEDDLTRLTNEMITELKALTGLDFEPGRADIYEMIDSRMSGNWDVSCEFENGLPSIRLVQQDEFDQHREGNEDLEDLDDDYDFTVGGDYVWVERNGWENRPSVAD